MGAVYVVCHKDTGAQLALKVMHPEIVADPMARARFAQEARIASMIESAFVVTVTDAGVDDATGMPFLVMELLRGAELGELLKQRGRFSVADVVTYLGQAAKALDKAHAKGIIHRDLKPENLFLCDSDDRAKEIRILDFGIAKIIQSAAHATTQGAGTPLYMAPEQTRRGRDVGPWTDVWALGLIAYALLVGRTYWEADTIGELFGEILAPDHEPASARAARFGVALPAGFDAWFARCVHDDPTRRFGRAGEASAALAAALTSGVAGSGLSRPEEDVSVTPPRPPVVLAAPVVIVGTHVSATAQTTPMAAATPATPGLPTPARRVAGRSAYAVASVGAVACIGLAIAFAPRGAKHALEPAGERARSGAPTDLAVELRNEYTQGVDGLERTGKPDFSRTIALVEAIRRMDPQNGHAWYYSGEIKRVSKPDMFSAKRCFLGWPDGKPVDLGPYQEDFYRYLEVAATLPAVALSNPSAEICYGQGNGYCLQRTAWIYQLLAIDFYRTGLAMSGVDRITALTQAKHYVNGALKYRTPEGTAGFNQCIPSTLLLDKLNAELANPTRASSSAR